LAVPDNVVMVGVANNDSGESFSSAFAQIEPEMVVQRAYAICSPCVIDQR
jgi:hypothetical protein